MLYLVTGGSGSGKSAFAENLIVSEYAELNINSKNNCEDEGCLFYVAHMYPYINGSDSNEKIIDDETSDRIKRHRDMRAKKGFCTIEKYVGIREIVSRKADGFLFECMSNLLANEMYLDNGNISFSEPYNEQFVVDNIVNPICDIAKRASIVVVVTNEIYEDRAFDDETKKYIKYLACINRQLGKFADRVYEVCCGIPILIKGEN